MFGKKKRTEAEKQERKARKFLSKKFNNSVKAGKLTTGLTAALAAPMAFVDGGLTFALVMAGGAGGIITLGSFAEDMAAQKELIKRTKAGQRLYGAQWAHDFYRDLEAKLIETSDKLKYLSPSDKKKRRKLEAKKEKLLDFGKDLSAYLKVADKNDQPTGEALLIMTAYPTKDREKNAENIIDLSTGQKKNSPKPGGFGL